VGRCLSTIQEVHFILTDPQITEVYIAVSVAGDCPLGAQGWHYKAFPARMSVLEIMTGGGLEDHLLWPLKAPDMAKVLR